MSLLKVLVILERNAMRDGEIALKRAVSLIQEPQSSIHVVAFCYDALFDRSDIPLQIDRDTLQQQLMQDTEARLNKIVTPCQSETKATISCDVAWAKYIHEWLKSNGDGYDLVIKASQRDKSILYTPTDWHLLRNNHTPLLLVSGKQWKKRKHHVVATIDLSSKSKTQVDLNNKVIEQASLFANILGSDLHVVYALPISKVLKELDLIEPREEERKFKKANIEIIRSLARELEIPEGNIHIRAGDPDRVIAGTCKKIRAQLVVLGTVARKGVKAALIGNTAEQVLQASSIDVLAIRPD